MTANIKVLIALILSLAITGLISPVVGAADARNFNPARIIDDAVFTNSNSMSVQEIQKLLDSKVKCDTWGTKMANSTETRRQWMKRVRGLEPPFRCIAEYTENPITKESNYSRSTSPSGAISAAQIIYNYSKQFNINPQVIIATLQKENSLITDEWPNTKQYREALGFGCPDNVAPGAPACDPSYGSFSTQVYQAARHFRGYIDKPAGWYVTFNTGRNSILWNTNTSCGTSEVYIENRATVALYTYTPYRPNQAALNAQYGTGDGCSSYGNRNFYMFFTDWFGSTHGSVNIDSPLTITTEGTGSKLFTDMPITATFKIRNNTNQRQNIGTVAMAVRDGQGKNFDFGNKDVVIEPHQTYYYTASRTLKSEGDYTFWITNHTPGVGWRDDYPSSIHKRDITDFIQNTPTVVTPITSSVDKIHKGQTSKVRFTVRNNSSRPVNLGYFGVSIIDPEGRNADLPYTTLNNLGVGQSHVYEKDFTPAKEGVYKARISATIDGGKTWSETRYPAPTNESQGNITSFTVTPNPTIVEGLKFDKTLIRENEPVTGTFKVRNFASQEVTVNRNICFIVRSDKGKNHDLGCLPLNKMAANTEAEFKVTRPSLPPGKYNAYFSTFQDGAWKDNWALPLETGKEPVKAELVVKEGVSLLQGLGVDKSTYRAGDKVEGTFKVKNWSSAPLNKDEKLCMIVRKENSWVNYDLGCENMALQPGQEKEFKGQKSFLDPGKYNAYFSWYKDGKWYDHSTPSLETGAEKTKLSFTVTPNPTIVEGLKFDKTLIRENEPVTGTFKVRNFASQEVTVNRNICFIVRSDKGKNHDLGCLPLNKMAANTEAEFKVTRPSLPPGKYNAYFSTFQDGVWKDNWALPLETGKEPVKAELVVK